MLEPFRPASLRGLVVTLTLVTIAACSGASTQPSDQEGNRDPLTVTVHVVSDRTHEPLPGAVLTVDLGTAVQTSPGVWVISTSTGSRSVSISRAGSLTRRVSLPAGANFPADVTLDLVDTSAPFDAAGYRQLLFDDVVHVGADFYKLRQAPLVRIYDSTPAGLIVASSLIAQAAAVIVEALPIWSGGTLTVRGVETVSGSGVAEIGANDTIVGGSNGVLTVQFQDTLTVRGQPVVGAGWLNNFGFQPGIRLQLGYVSASTTSLSAAGRETLMHELGHAMGFLHHSMPEGSLRPQPVGGISSTEAFLARVAYSRDLGLRWEDDTVGSPVAGASADRLRSTSSSMGVQP